MERIKDCQCSECDFKPLLIGTCGAHECDPASYKICLDCLKKAVQMLEPSTYFPESVRSQCELDLALFGVAGFEEITDPDVSKRNVRVDPSRIQLDRQTGEFCVDGRPLKGVAKL